MRAVVQHSKVECCKLRTLKCALMPSETSLVANGSADTSSRVNARLHVNGGGSAPAVI